MKKLVSHEEMLKLVQALAGSIGQNLTTIIQGIEGLYQQTGRHSNQIFEIERKIEELNLKVDNFHAPDVVFNDVGLDKDYSGHGWYKATDTGIIYNKGVPEGETHVFSDGDPTQYLSVYTKEDAVDNIYVAATSNITDLSSAFFNEEEYKSFYNGQNLSHWDVSNVTNFEKMFFYAQVPDIVGIRNWKTSSATNMARMFTMANLFNSDISKWDVSNVTSMRSMFSQARAFNQDISGWDVSNVEDMGAMFNFTDKFNQDLSQWCVAKIPTQPEGWEGYENIVPPVWGTCPRGEDGSNPKAEPDDQGLAKDYPGTGWYKATDTGVVYNKDVPKGEVHTFEGDPKEYISVYTKEDAFKHAEYAATSNLTDMSMLFRGESSFNGDISHWDTSNVTNMSNMFAGATAFDQPLNFDTSSVTNMSGMFQGAESFNQPLSFDTSKVTIINSMFYGATSFNQPLSFDTSKVTNTSYMFSGATAYNQPIKLDTSNVTDMNNMFARAASFNKPLSLNTSKVTNMSCMFQEATSFNQPLDFDTSSVVDMRYMLSEATAFNQPLNFDTSSATLMNGAFSKAESFNQDLSQWCVSKIPSTPPLFDEDASAWIKPRPVWGTCPRGEDQAVFA